MNHEFTDAAYIRRIAEAVCDQDFRIILHDAFYEALRGFQSV